MSVTIPFMITHECDHPLYDYPLLCPQFIDDTVMLSDTSAHAWIQPFECYQNGHSVWQTLVEHPDGGGQKEYPQSPTWLKKGKEAVTRGMLMP